MTVAAPDPETEGPDDADGHETRGTDAGRPDDGTPAAPASPVRALATLLLRPRRFFRTAVEPGEQGSALLSAMAVVAVEEATRMALVPGAVPGMADAGLLAVAFWLGVAVLVVTPVALHLLAALQTLVLVPFVRDRGGVAETVQVLAYATAPCAVAGVPVPELRVLATAWGAAILVVGVSEVHGPGLEPAFVLSAPASALVFGYGFRGFAALATLLSRWYII